MCLLACVCDGDLIAGSRVRPFPLFIFYVIGGDAGGGSCPDPLLMRAFHVAAEKALNKHGPFGSKNSKANKILRLICLSAGASGQRREPQLFHGSVSLYKTWITAFRKPSMCYISTA